MNFKYLKHLASGGAAYIHPKGYPATSALIEKLALQDGLKILDYGCGTGTTLIEIALKHNVIAEGVDILEEMLSRAKQNITAAKLGDKINVQKILPDAKLNFSAGTFDRIYAESVLGFQDETLLSSILSELNRVSKPGGLLILNDALWKEGVSDEKVRSIINSSIKDFGLPPVSPSGITLPKMLKIAGLHGYDLAESISLDEGKLQRANNPAIMPAAKEISLLNTTRNIAYRLKERRHKADAQYFENWLLVFKKSGQM